MRIYQVRISTFIVQEDYMDEPENWDWSNLLYRIPDFKSTPDIKITEVLAGVVLDIEGVE